MHGVPSDRLATPFPPPLIASPLLRLVCPSLTLWQFLQERGSTNRRIRRRWRAWWRRSRSGPWGRACRKTTWENRTSGWQKERHSVRGPASNMTPPPATGCFRICWSSWLVGVTFTTTSSRPQGGTLLQSICSIKCTQGASFPRRTP